MKDMFFKKQKNDQVKQLCSTNNSCFSRTSKDDTTIKNKFSYLDVFQKIYIK